MRLAECICILVVVPSSDEPREERWTRHWKSAKVGNVFKEVEGRNTPPGSEEREGDSVVSPC